MPRQLGENFPNAGLRESPCPAFAATPAACTGNLPRVPWPDSDLEQTLGPPDFGERPARSQLGYIAYAPASQSSLGTSSPARRSPSVRESSRAFRNQSDRKILSGNRSTRIAGRFVPRDAKRK